MKKIILTILLFSTIFINNSFGISEDTRILMALIKSETEANRNLIKANRDLIKAETKANRDLIKANRELIKANQIATNKRFEDMQKLSDAKFEATNLRFEAINDKFNMIVTIMLGGFTLVMGYLLKERSGIKKEITKEIKPELIKKADKKTVDRILYVIEDMAIEDIQIKNILIKHNLKAA